MMINYGLLHDSIEFYENRGYKRIETPWLVTKAIHDITAPKDAASYVVKKSIETNEKLFVASGEQSFLYLINKGHLPKDGIFQTITPCMRNDSFDSTHTKYFMKNELIVYSTEVKNVQFLKNIIEIMTHDAFDFFLNYTGTDCLEICSTGNDSCDILYNGVEIGSYGIRKCDFCQWIYGTGLAEPRFSTLLRKQYNDRVS